MGFFGSDNECEFKDMCPIAGGDGSCRFCKLGNYQDCNLYQNWYEESRNQKYDEHYFDIRKRDDDEDDNFESFEETIKPKRQRTERKKTTRRKTSVTKTAEKKVNNNDNENTTQTTTTANTLKKNKKSNLLVGLVAIISILILMWLYESQINTNNEEESTSIIDQINNTITESSEISLEALADDVINKVQTSSTISNDTQPETANSTFIYSGTIDGKYPITMTITTQNNIVTGSYYYDKNGPDKTLRIEGNATGTMPYKLNEFNNDGKNTGIFLVDQEISTSTHLIGKYILVSKDKTMTFDLVIK